MSKKYSPWYAPEVKPTKPGVYQRDYAGKEQLGVVYEFFDGRHWGLFGWTPYDAKLSTFARSGYALKWRGLAEDPNKKDKV